MVGNSTYGEYFLYAVKQGNNEEYNFFAPEEVHVKLKELHKGDKVQITKIATQSGSKILTDYELKVVYTSNGKQKEQTQPVNADIYFQAMLSSYQDALKIQEQLNGMVDVNRIAITLFIARSKVNGNGYGG